VLNGVDLSFTADDMIGRDEGWDVVLAGDVFYDRDFAKRIIPWFAALAARGATVLVGDPGRAYCPRDRMEPVAVYSVPVTRALEDSEVKKTTVWRFSR
jgi:predicted nicotinamide N-methyase